MLTALCDPARATSSQPNELFCVYLMSPVHHRACLFLCSSPVSLPTASVSPVDSVSPLSAPCRSFLLLFVWLGACLFPLEVKRVYKDQNGKEKVKDIHPPVTRKHQSEQ